MLRFTFRVFLNWGLFGLSWGHLILVLQFSVFYLDYRSLWGWRHLHPLHFIIFQISFRHSFLSCAYRLLFLRALCLFLLSGGVLSSDPLFGRFLVGNIQSLSLRIRVLHRWLMRHRGLSGLRGEVHLDLPLPQLGLLSSFDGLLLLLQLLKLLFPYVLLGGLRLVVHGRVDRRIQVTEVYRVFIQLSFSSLDHAQKRLHIVFLHIHCDHHLLILREHLRRLLAPKRASAVDGFAAILDIKESFHGLVLVTVYI